MPRALLPGVLAAALVVTACGDGGDSPTHPREPAIVKLSVNARKGLMVTVSTPARGGRVCSEVRARSRTALPGGYAEIRSRSCSAGDGGPSYLVISSHSPRESILVAAGTGRCGDMLAVRFAGGRFRPLLGSCAHQLGGQLGLYVLPEGNRIRLRGLNPLSELHLAAFGCPARERLCLRQADRRGQPVK